MLKKPVVDAVREGKFHVWAIRNVDEGIQILTGVKAGERQEDGSVAADTGNALVDAKLAELAERLAQFRKPLSPPIDNFPN